MIDLDKQKEHFKNHEAKFTDYGNIKILDFKNPSDSYYRIRFLFEERDIGNKGYEELSKVFDDAWEFVSNIGKEKNRNSRSIYACF